MKPILSMSLRLLALSPIALSLFGCAMHTGDGVTPTSVTTLLPQSTVQGVVHGGQNPIGNAYVQLYAVGSTAYGAGAVPLIATQVIGDSTTQSTVTTNASTGAFTITGQYSCPTPSTPVYITAVAGDPQVTVGDGYNNKQVALMAALGPCSNLSSSTYVVINEVTTVAAVWALQGFIGYTPGTSLYAGGGSNIAGVTTPATGFSIGVSSGNTQGLINAMGVAQILANTSSGTSSSTTYTATNTSISNIERGTINLLGNILSSCVNSAGGGISGGASDGTNCGNLLFDANPTTTNYPADVLQAAYLIARNPGHNVTAIVGLAPASGAPFGNASSTSFNDFTIAYNIGAGTTASYNTTFASPGWIAFDSFGNAWVYNMDIEGSSGTTATAPFIPYLSEISPTGALISTVNQYYAGGSLIYIGNGQSAGLSNNYPPQVIVDTNNDAYALDHVTGDIFAVHGSTGAGVAGAGVYTTNAIVTGAAGPVSGQGIKNIVLDGQGNLWFGTGVAGASPFSTTSGSIESFATSSFATGTATSVNQGSTAVGSNVNGMTIDNTPTSTTGGPFIWSTNTGNCVGASPLQAVTYGDLIPVDTTTANAGKQAAFKNVADSGVNPASSNCTAAAVPNLLPTVSVTYSGNIYTAAPLALNYWVGVDSTNSLWFVNTQDAWVASVSGSATYANTNNFSITHVTPTYSGTTATFSNVAEANAGSGGLSIAASVGGSTGSSVFEAAIDGAGNLWSPEGANAVIGEFSYNSTTNTVNAVSPSTGYIGTGSARTGASKKHIAIDRSGNIWSTAVSSTGLIVTVVVGAATPVYTPLTSGKLGVLPQ